ncbi:MAG TPA: acyl carrier protein [Candidatus Eisenbacteria bacterium]|nr:acyl carrier protein [Candidatus Eisenbacteria bacterium]
MERVSARRQDPTGCGHLGLRELLEPQLRRLVAERLGTPEEWLRPEVSLVHDLAVDSLDLTEIAVEAEQRFDVSLPEATMDRVRTYGDLVDVVIDARLTTSPPAVPSVFVRASVLPAARDGRGVVTRSAWLSAYTVETLAADARRAGPGAKLAITVPAAAPLATAERVERCFAHLGPLGVAVDVHHERPRDRRAVA